MSVVSHDSDYDIVDEEGEGCHAWQGWECDFEEWCEVDWRHVGEIHIDAKACRLDCYKEQYVHDRQCTCNITLIIMIEKNTFFVP